MNALDGLTVSACSALLATGTWATWNWQRLLTDANCALTLSMAGFYALCWWLSRR